MIAFTFSGSSLPSAAGAIAGRPDFSFADSVLFANEQFLIEMLERLDTKIPSYGLSASSTKGIFVFSRDWTSCCVCEADRYNMIDSLYFPFLNKCLNLFD